MNAWFPIISGVRYGAHPTEQSALHWAHAHALRGQKIWVKEGF